MILIKLLPQAPLDLAGRLRAAGRGLIELLGLGSEARWGSHRHPASHGHPAGPGPEPRHLAHRDPVATGGRRSASRDMRRWLLPTTARPRRRGNRRG